MFVKIMITCKKATEYILKSEDGDLTNSQKRSLWFHLIICRMCKRFDRQNTLLNAALNKKVGASSKLSDDDKNKMIRSMVEEKND
ncbi:hypothetical protein CLV98_103158 [Dyadobacter jejuensis]|uniref:Uncharacterized protein n=1 Tax=Dyadobacter jejuensis TaxID=1082580 RepID=A0A316AMK5_9BACT|nr:hypothetical protein CLV98_103158 [Dyadobacter jejuensis]